MPTYIKSETISIQDRQALIQSFPCFAALSTEQSRNLATLLQEVSYNKGEVVVTQDEMVDAVYFIVSGQVEISIQSEYKKQKSVVPVAILGPGESIGLNDSGFFSSTGKRTATAKAMTELNLLYLDLKALHAFLRTNNLESGMYAAAEQMLRMQLIKQSVPFGKLSHERLQWLSEKVEDLAIPAGTVLFNQGDQGDKCYLIRSGKIEIIATEANGSTHSLALLKPPTLFGEATLVTRGSRNAGALAVEDSQLLVLSYEYLSELWEKEQNVANMFMTLMVDRSRPSRNLNVSEYPRSTLDGQTIVILKNPDSASYFKLSQEGWFIWQQLNGQQTLMEITMALAKQYQVFSPNMVTALISKLARAEFVKNVNVAELSREEESRVEKWISRARAILEVRFFFKKVDYWLSKSYQKGIGFLFTRLGQLIIATLTLCGFAAFFVTENHVVHLLRTLHASWLLFVCMIPLMALTAVLHELGHAYTTKFFGREVHAMGVGWNWTQPVAFTDTTDMWLASSRHRILVNAAGIYTNLFVAGFCSLLILIVPSYYMQAFLWLFALTTYIKGFAMLNPSQDLDGYYIMMDLFERPYLRRDATGWLVKQLPAALRQPSLFLKYGPELSYWLVCIVFLTLTAIITLYVQGFVFKLLGMQAPNIVTALIIPTITVAVSSVALISDIRNLD